MKIPKKALLILTFAVCTGFAMTGPASACYQACVEVSPGCLQCQNVGYLTGIVCIVRAECSCKEGWGVCAPIESRPAGGDPQASLTDLGISEEPEPSQCSATVE
jgi:hypothetical protein